MSTTAQSRPRAAHGELRAPRDLTASPFLAAARGRRPARLPVWFMRQAGRSLPEYRALREGVPMLKALFDPEMIAEITLQPVRRLGVDAAVFFSDIVVPLVAAGIDVDIVPGTGPVVAAPVRDADAIARMPELDPARLEPVIEGTRLVVDRLGETPLIGFAGAPFTLASYLIEGGPSRTHERTKALMHSEPALWHDLAARLAGIAVTFLRGQVEAGADAVQLFDSWAGALTLREYREFVQPHSARVLAAVADLDVPRIHFGVGTGELLPAMRDAGADVVGVDWRVPLDEAVRRLTANGEPTPVVQGNLDPALLQASWPVIEAEVRRIAAEGRAAAAHIFNLGHGVPPGADPEVLTRIVELVHSLEP
ncbi:uroporphyrinogen decarboxylase [Amycolatopsis viridis]|uniref:Uroporphyrinogen decarboxylase n=1 Tax=Amycolatopsis viridis TaxID=185678 RepID=A0ABX0SUL1_9PSEU|nr:uroporphyrinogen decarboxylase [Amycolatopsis viridis]NIH79627.1 uroporphyrinogen decarboxylase [Amycolatopsis viridis]